MKKQDHTFMTNTMCPYFPCHAGADVESFNCLFCFCPLYALGEACGGAFHYTEGGIKDCSHCLLPHSEGGYDYILEKSSQLMELARRKEEERL